MLYHAYSIHLIDEIWVIFKETMGLISNLKNCFTNSLTNFFYITSLIHRFAKQMFTNLRNVSSCKRFFSICNHSVDSSYSFSPVQLWFFTSAKCKGPYHSCDVLWMQRNLITPLQGTMDHRPSLAISNVVVEDCSLLCNEENRF